jgi:hypothetical protein
MRVRISTTVDEARLEQARVRSGQRDSEMFDAALAALLDQIDRETEFRALSVLPYESSEFGSVAGVPAEPYDGPVPRRVQQLAVRRRVERQRRGLR